MTRKLKAVAACVVVGLCGFAMWLGYIGYFGGPVYYEIPAERTPSIAAPGIVAVVFSGDMGFRVGMGPKIAARLAGDGIPVLGVSSLEHFRQRRSPDDIRRFIAGSAAKALRFAHADRLILIGQSFGADMLQYGADGLPPDMRSKVQLVALVVPGDTVNFRASPAELFDYALPDAAALPTARRLDWAPMVCIRGMEEENSLCPQLDAQNVRHITLPGGHPLRRDVDGLYGALRSAIIATGPIGNGITTGNGITKISEKGQSEPMRFVR